MPGRRYEQGLGRNGVPATYFEYLALLRDVFDECKRVLERIEEAGYDVFSSRVRAPTWQKLAVAARPAPGAGRRAPGAGSVR